MGLEENISEGRWSEGLSRKLKRVVDLTRRAVAHVGSVMNYKTVHRVSDLVS